MCNLDAARQAFAAWAAQYETTSHPEDPCGGTRLLEALHACGVSSGTRSLWRDTMGNHHVVELICMATPDEGERNGTIAVYRDGSENWYMRSRTFLARFSPLAGDGEHKGGMRGGAGE